MRIGKAEITAARQKRDRLLQRGQQLQKDWIELYLDISAFRKSVIAETFEWELCGYRTVQHFDKAMWTALGDSRSSYKEKLRTVETLKPEKIRALGKTKAFAATRLARAGKLTKENEEKLEAATPEEAPRLAARLVGRTVEGRSPVTFLLLDSQHERVTEQLERLMRVLALETKEAAFDAIIGWLSDMSDHELRMTFEAGRKDAVEVA